VGRKLTRKGKGKEAEREKNEGVVFSVARDLRKEGKLE